MYCYPRDVRERIRDCGGCEIGEGVMGLLVQLRGVFVTLSDIMGSITFQHQSWLVHTHLLSIYLSPSLSLSSIYLVCISNIYYLHTPTHTHTHTHTHSSTVALA